MGSPSLPHYVAFKGDNGKFLGFYLDDEHCGFLKFGYDDLSSPYVKHEVVSDPTNQSNVHIKCCYNNKFWRRKANNENWIIAGENSINGDQANCTLFDTIVWGSNEVCLRSIQVNRFVVSRTTERLDSCLSADIVVADDIPFESSAMPYFDLGLLVTLPKYVAFKGYNGMYLAACSTESQIFLQFNTDDIGSEHVRHEVVPAADGTVLLKCLQWNKFWKRTDNWIWVDPVEKDLTNKDMLFRPVKVDDQTVALRCLGNNLFCKCLTTEGTEAPNCLNAGTSSMERSAILRVEEPTFSRRMHSIKYHMDTAHIYDSQPLVLFKATATNNSDQPNQLQVSFAYTERKSTSWKSAVSFTTGIKTTMEAGIPLVVGGKVEISAQFTYSTDLGVTTETQTTQTGTYTAPVQEGKKMELTVKATHAKCDVKFSYVQEDLLTTGETVKVMRDDGVFNGVGHTDVHFETRYF